MKVLLTNEHCDIGGVETFMITLAVGLQKCGNECELFFFQHGPMERQMPPNCVAHFGDAADLMKLVSSRKFDIVHAHSSDWGMGVSVVCGIGVKLIVTVQHDWIVPAWTSANCDALVACSTWLTEEQQAFSDLRVQTVLYGIDTDRFAPGERTVTVPPIVAWVGRGAGGQKRIDKFAAIAPALHRAGMRLWLAEPNGPEEVEKVVPGIKHTLLPIVDFWGSVAREKMPDFFREVAASGGCVVCTSSSEGLGLAWVEAQACGCPVIGPDVRGINECVSPEHGGVLYPFEMDAEQLANLVIETISDTKQMHQRGEVCAQHVCERFGVERMIQEYLHVYQGSKNAQRKSLVRLSTWLKPVTMMPPPEYKKYRWTEGHSQYETSRKLAEQGYWGLAAAAARQSLITCPTLYAKPRRLAHFVKTYLHSNFPLHRNSGGKRRLKFDNRPDRDCTT